MTADSRACTCHPSEAPQPCQHRFAYSECRRAALVEKVGKLLWYDGSGFDVPNHLIEAAIDLIRAETLEEAAVRLDREWPGPASSIVRALKEKA